MTIEDVRMQRGKIKAEYIIHTHDSVEIKNMHYVQSNKEKQSHQ